MLKRRLGASPKSESPSFVCDECIEAWDSSAKI